MPSERARVVLERLVDRHVDVALVERLRGCGEDGDRFHARFDGAIEPPHVWHEDRELHTRIFRNVAIHLGGIRHLRNPLRTDERAGLDHAQSRIGERSDVVDLHVGRDRDLFVLQTVAWADLDDLHGVYVDLHEQC